MAGFKLQGSLCAVTNALPIDSGTLVRGASPGRVSVGTALPVTSSPAAVSPDQIMEDAIALYEASPTGKGKPNLQGPADYIDRFKKFASEVDAKLTELSHRKKLKFTDLGPRQRGAGSSNLIFINSYFQPDPVGRQAAYLEDLAMTALELAHEGVMLLKTMNR